MKALFVKVTPANVCSRTVDSWPCLPLQFGENTFKAFSTTTFQFFYDGQGLHALNTVKQQAHKSMRKHHTSVSRVVKPVYFTRGPRNCQIVASGSFLGNVITFWCLS